LSILQIGLAPSLFTSSQWILAETELSTSC
jgi:hypothetical protein